MKHPMPITPHDACTEPTADTRICRFIDLPKFRDLFANEELYFRRTDLFKETDPNEALPSDEYARRILRLERYDLHGELALNNDFPKGCGMRPGNSFHNCGRGLSVRVLSCHHFMNAS